MLQASDCGRIFVHSHEAGAPLFCPDLSMESPLRRYMVVFSLTIRSRSMPSLLHTHVLELSRHTSNLMSNSPSSGSRANGKL